MINPESRTREWIESIRTQYPYIKDVSLLEKTIRAFSLLESLVRSGCPFVFKGGIALMLHLGSTRRLSIDIDIVCKPGTNIWDYLERYASEYGFTDVKEVSRKARSNVPKSHAAYEYLVSYPIRQVTPVAKSCWTFCTRISTTPGCSPYPLRARF